MKQLLVFTLLFFFTSSVNAQDAAKLLEAEMYLKNNEFEKAKNVYEELFTEFDDFRNKNKRKAIMGYTKAVTWWILGPKGELIDNPEELLKPYPYLINYTQYPASKIKLDEEAKVYKHYTQALYNVAYRQLHKEQDENNRSAIKLCDAAISIDNTNCDLYSLRSLMNDRLGNYYDAIEDNKKAIYLYEMNFDSLEPNQSVHYAYYNLAYYLSGKVDGVDVKNIDSSMHYINMVYTIMDKDKSRFEAIDDFNAILGDKFLKENIETLELAIYLENPNYLASTVSRFKEEVDKDPTNYDLNVAYAGLLAIHDTAKAIIQYKRAIQLDSTQTIAYYNLAALHINIASRISSEVFDFTPFEDIEKARVNTTANYKKAYLLLVKAHNLASKDRDILYRLVKLTAWLNMDTENELYQQKLEQLDQ